MNIISNSCVGGYIYKNELKTAFENPFIWNRIDFESMLYLINNYDHINWNNYELKKDNHWNFNLIIDNNVNINLVHYKFNAKYNKITQIGHDIFYNKIWKYIIDKYNIRLKRMLNKNESPIYIFADKWNKPETLLTYDRLKKLNSLNKNNIIVAVNKIYPEFTFIKQIQIKLNKNDFNDILAKEIYTKFLMDIK